MTRHAIRIAQLTSRDPRHVEAHMRAEGRLSQHMGRSEFADEVRYAAAVIDELGEDKSERLARKLGL